MDRPPAETEAASTPDAPGAPRLSGPAGEVPRSAMMEARLRAMVAAARHHGVDLDPKDFRGQAGEDVPSAASLVNWAREQGLMGRALNLRWRNLFRFHGTPPTVLLFNDGSAGLLVEVDAARDVVWLKDPVTAPSEPPVAVDQLRLSQVWTGEVVLVRRQRSKAEVEAPFNLGWISGLVMEQTKLMRDISIASLVLSVLTIVPALLVMSVIDRVVTHHSMSTLVLLSSILVILSAYETLLGWSRRELTGVLSARIDTKLSLHIFNRLLALPVDYFEHNPAGMTISKLFQVFKVRDFLTGKLLSTFLDAFTLVFLLPFLFWLDATLAWMVVAASGLIAVIIMIFLKPVGRLVGKVIAAENRKASVMSETVQGIRTIKTLALEPARRAEWDECVAESTAARLAALRMSNWPQSIITPIDMFISRGVIMVGAYFAISDTTGLAAGGLIAFMMLGQRVTAPLVGIAKLLEEMTDVRASVGEVGSVLNQPTETRALTTGMRPRLAGHIVLEGLTFTYPRAKNVALDNVGFEVPAGTMLGLVGRSGSGKSTITRLLQGINREYSGFLKIDGVELREINLTHLRRNLGIVLQDNFLFRGTVRDNISAGRPGLTLEDVVRAARLAGAEEFIERLPQGYETWIEEGSANISGGQRQRLAIARAVISDPRILILDEATSALDPESEALVNANLQRIAKGRTMVIVSHRLSSLIDCDQIAVMDRGKLIDIAPHNVLVERCSIYRQLWLQQNRHLNEKGRQASLAPVLAQGD